jgi:hypothetical protein
LLRFQPQDDEKNWHGRQKLHLMTILHVPYRTIEIDNWLDWKKTLIMMCKAASGRCGS